MGEGVFGGGAKGEGPFGGRKGTSRVAKWFFLGFDESFGKQSEPGSFREKKSRR